MVVSSDATHTTLGIDLTAVPQRSTCHATVMPNSSTTAVMLYGGGGGGTWPRAVQFTDVLAPTPRVL